MFRCGLGNMVSTNCYLKLRLAEISETDGRHPSRLHNHCHEAHQRGVDTAACRRFRVLMGEKGKTPQLNTRQRPVPSQYASQINQCRRFLKVDKLEFL